MASGTHTADDASSDEQAPLDERWAFVGALLAVLGGFLYALGALLVSYAGAQGWSDRRVKCWSVMSWLSTAIGAFSVTFAYQSGASVPLMNAIVYSTNLVFNMLFQMIFKLRNYTKSMRCGTVLFALNALLLGDLSPPPHKVNLDLLLTPSAMVWNSIFLCMFVSSALMLLSVQKLPNSSSFKIMIWATHLGCWGSFADNWAKANGVFDPSSTMYWVLFIPYCTSGMLVLVLSVVAMASTDVAIYVPANLCVQMVFNVISGILVWHEASRIPHMLAYLVGYSICVVAVYIATPEMDIVASWKKAQEMRSRSLSQQVARTAFGRAMLVLLDKWSRLADQFKPADAPVVSASADGDKALVNETKQALETVLVTGLSRVAFSQEQLVNLTLALWQKGDERFGPCEETVRWFRTIPYFQEYLEKDPAFGDNLTSLLPGMVASSLAGSPVVVDPASQVACQAGAAEVDVEANVLLHP